MRARLRVGSIRESRKQTRRPPRARSVGGTGGGGWRRHGWAEVVGEGMGSQGGGAGGAARRMEMEEICCLTVQWVPHEGDWQICHHHIYIS
jgi:hypothetical protein